MYGRLTGSYPETDFPETLNSDLEGFPQKSILFRHVIGF